MFETTVQKRPIFLEFSKIMVKETGIFDKPKTFETSVHSSVKTSQLKIVVNFWTYFRTSENDWVFRIKTETEKRPKFLVFYFCENRNLIWTHGLKAYLLFANSSSKQSHKLKRKHFLFQQFKKENTSDYVLAEQLSI